MSLRQKAAAFFVCRKNRRCFKIEKYTKSPIPWMGGKAAMRPVILASFPLYFKRYVEVFGGGAAILLGKQPQKFEVYNDFNSDLVNLFRCIKDRPLSFFKTAEAIYDLLSRKERPEGYSGYPLSQSDVIELYDEDGSEFHYVDSYGFVKLDEAGPELAKEIEQETMMRGAAAEGEVKSAEMQAETVPEDIQSPNEPDDEFQVETFKISM